MGGFPALGQNPEKSKLKARRHCTLKPLRERSGIRGGPADSAIQDAFRRGHSSFLMLEELGLMIKVEEYENKVGFSERADVPIEPRISMQWFLKYPAVDDATKAVAEDGISYCPAHWAKTYANWMNGIQDWCVSRQLW